MTSSSELVPGELTSPEGDIVGLSIDELDSNAIISSVKDDGAGAVAVFLGTTRDVFQGKRVTKLTYEAYTPLCLRTLLTICTSARLLPPTSTVHHSAPTTNPAGRTLTRVAIHHRLGTVPVGETSICIAVSSPHRREAFEACEWILEEVKKKAQIWKREWYADEECGGEKEAVWKENFPGGKWEEPTTK